MNKAAIKRFAIEARNKLRNSVTDKAGMLGITQEECSGPVTTGPDFKVYQTAAGTEVTLNKSQCELRKKLVDKIAERGFDAVVEEVAYTWFNRICAIRFMEVNDYLPSRVRVLSSEKDGKNEPDLVTMAPDVDLPFTEEEREKIYDLKMKGTTAASDELFQKLFIKQCNALHEILPELFEETQDYTELLLDISYANKDDVIYMLVNQEDGIPEADFNVTSVNEQGEVTGQVEIIGWLYQYYNTELKDDTFAKLKKNIKITKERIPAATQLFTPDWIVRYMVENSVGRIWIDHLRALDPSVNEKETAEKFGWKYYLPEAKQEESVDVKLAEIRSNYKDLKPTDILCIDPCMGSGHILIAMFDVLMDIYTSTGYSEREAAFEIVEHNIHGLDIDQRAYQLAYFAVMMKGRGYNRRFFRGRDDVKPMPKVYAIAESNDISRSHLSLFGQSMEAKRRETAKEQMEYLLDIFKDGREYGSILNVEECDWKLLQEYVEDLDADGQITFESYGSEETQKSLRLLIKVAKNLGQKYDAVVTNPPYMGVSVAGPKLNEYVRDWYFKTKTDLYAVFMVRNNMFTKKGGYYSLVTQHSWMFLKSFTDLRKKIMKNNLVNMTHLGTRAFEEIGGEVVQTTSFIVRNEYINHYNGTYIRLVEQKNSIDKKDGFFKIENRYICCSNKFNCIEDSPIAYWVPDSLLDIFQTASKIDNYGDVKVGMQTGENDKFIRLWTEIAFSNFKVDANDALEAEKSNCKWFPYNKGGEYRKWYGNNDWVVDWYKNGQNIKQDKLYKLSVGKCLPSNSKPKNMQYYFKPSITWSKVSSGAIAFRFKPAGNIFDIAGASIFSKRENLFYMQGFCNSKVAMFIAFVLSPTINYEAGTVSKFPIVFNTTKYDIVCDLVKNCIDASKEDYNSFETSWDFQTHPLLRQSDTMYLSWENDDKAYDVSKEAGDIPFKHYIKLAYESWENECDNRFAQLKANEEELNRIFIAIYGLQDELTPEVEDKDVTVRKADLGRDIRSFISYAVGCMFGRYSIDKDGLMVAGQPFESVYFEATAPRAGTGVADASGDYVPTGEFYIKTEDGTKQCTYNPDRDNIIPITDEEYFSDDIVGRFVEFVETVYGKDTLEENLDFIAQALGNKGNSSREVIRNYFIKDFYKDHLKVYQKRPIYWLFDSGKQNGFKALIYMHRYDADTVGRVRTDYLHRTQNYVETAMKSAEYTIENTSVASEKSKAMKAVSKYTKQLAEMQTYDHAIAHVANQRIEIDLDDGVKVNYAKFQGVEVSQEGKKALKVDLLAKI